MFNRFEQIVAWQHARTLSRRIYAVSRTGGFETDYGLRDQIRGSAVSIMSNIAEGFERGGDKEFARYLDIAKGSAGEVRSLLYVALDAGYVTPQQFDELDALASECVRTIMGLLKHLRRPQPKSRKPK